MADQAAAVASSSILSVEEAEAEVLSARESLNANRCVQGNPSTAEPEDFDESDSEDDELTQSDGSNIQNLITSKIAQLEQQGKDEDEATGAGKASRRRTKELKQLMEGSSSVDDKLKALHQRYSLQLQESRKLERERSLLKRKCEQAQKEKDTIYGELTKTNAVKVKLEALCRELQKQNKLVLDDSKRIATEEQSKRQDLSKKFHSTIKEITTKLEEQGEERMKQFRENELLRDKLKNFAEQYEIREQHFAHQLKTKDLEQQLLEAKFRQQLEIAQQENLKAAAYKEQVVTLMKTEQELRSQLALYGEKFEQFQDTLTKSNQVFTSFKSEMDKMQKTIKKLEKENLSLKQKCEKTDITMINMLDERTVTKKQLETTKAQKDKLERLCRTLQSERSQHRDLSEKLKALCLGKGASEGEIQAIAAAATTQAQANGGDEPSPPDASLSSPQPKSSDAQQPARASASPPPL